MIKASILKQFKGANCLVTGGTGMIGRQVVEILAQAGAHIKIAHSRQKTLNCGERVHFCHLSHIPVIRY